MHGPHQDRIQGSEGHMHDPLKVVLDPYATAIITGGRRTFGQMGPVRETPTFSSSSYVFYDLAWKQCRLMDVLRSYYKYKTNTRV